MAINFTGLAKSAVLSSLIFLVFGSTTALAAPELRVGYVDMQKALQKSRVGSSASKDYEGEVKKAQASLDQRKKEFEKKRNSFSKQRASLNTEARVGKEEQLIKMEKELKRSFQDTQEELRRKNAQIVGGLVRQLKGVVNEVGKEKGFTIILEKSSQAVLYADSSIDITDEVVKKFDSRSK